MMKFATLISFIIGMVYIKYTGIIGCLFLAYTFIMYYLVYRDLIKNKTYNSYKLVINGPNLD